MFLWAWLWSFWFEQTTTDITSVSSIAMQRTCKSAYKDGEKKLSSCEWPLISHKIPFRTVHRNSRCTFAKPPKVKPPNSCRDRCNREQCNDICNWACSYRWRWTLTTWSDRQWMFDRSSTSMEPVGTKVNVSQLDIEAMEPVPLQ